MAKKRVDNLFVNPTFLWVLIIILAILLVGSLTGWFGSYDASLSPAYTAGLECTTSLGEPIPCFVDDIRIVVDTPQDPEAGFTEVVSASDPGIVLPYTQNADGSLAVDCSATGAVSEGGDKEFCENIYTKLACDQQTGLCYWSTGPNPPKGCHAVNP